ncbi:unnamed protein product [Rhodiola kirilowii]
MLKLGLVSLAAMGWAGPSGFGSSTTAEEVTEGIDATNLTAIVTGGACGIGFETSKTLALRGAHVVIAARNTAAANEAKQQIVKEIPSARIDVLKLDLASLKSVREFVDEFISINLPLNILINNAGIMWYDKKNGTSCCRLFSHIFKYLLTFMRYFAGHFLLTNLLLDKMKHTAETSGIQGRIVNLSSVAHQHTYPGGIRFDKINDKSSYNDKKAYGQSKLANILHANELSRRLKEEGVNITVNSVHPGLILTNLFQHHAKLMRVLYLLSFIIWKNVAQGAATTCYVALHPSLKGATGKYFTDCNEFIPTKLAMDENLRKKLWDFSNKLVSSAQTS